MDEKRQTINYELYVLDQSYKEGTNLNNYIKEAQNFYNGDQYPNSNFKNMIRISINICSFAATIKASKLCSTPIYLTFTADDNDTDCTALRRFDEYNCNKLRQKQENFQAALNGFVNGTEVTFIRWDEDDTSYKGIYKGGLALEHLELRNFALANPYIKDIQNQEWLMYWDDVPVRAVLDMIEGTDEVKKQKREDIFGEGGIDYGDSQKVKEYINHELIRLFVRFFRIKGEVYFDCQTQRVDLFEYPHPLSRKVAKVQVKKIKEEFEKRNKGLTEEDNQMNGLTQVNDYEIDYEDIFVNSSKVDILTDEEYADIKDKFYLYPFAVFRPFNQNGSFYGRSDIKSLIPTQKAINFMISMTLKCAENNAYNKIFAKPEALQGQEITNEPSQVIIDYSGFTNGWGIKMAESQPIPNGLLDFTDRLLAMTRVIYGFNDVMDGSITNQDMSGYMLQQMIKQANTPLEQQQQLFWGYNEDMAAIRLMYYKHYVDEAKYTYELTDSEYEQEEQARQVLLNAVTAREKTGKKFETIPDNAKPEDFKNKTHKTQVRKIKGEDLYGRNFDISIESMQGLTDSKLVEQQMWDNLFLNGGINNIDPELLEMYFQASPNVSERTKTAIKGAIERMKLSQNKQLEENNKQLLQYCQQLITYIKQLEGRQGYQSEYIKNLNSEFTNKINMANKMIGALQTDLNKKSQGEVKSNNARGIRGSTTTEQVAQQSM